MGSELICKEKDVHTLPRQISFRHFFLSHLATELFFKVDVCFVLFTSSVFLTYIY